MKLNEVFAVLEGVAPVALSDEFCKKYSMYDNSGIILRLGEDVNGALFSLDFSPAAVKKAVECGYNLIVTHHPAIYGGINRLGEDPQSAAIAECIRHGISVISMHLNFDAAPQGIDFNLMRGLGGSECEVLAPVSGGGYGRIYNIEKQVFGDYFKEVCREFNTSRALFFGDEKKTVSRVASFCGAGCDERAIKFAADGGADVFVSSDMKHHEICALVQRGINVIHLTHYSAENYGFEKIYQKIKGGLKINTAYFTDGCML